MNDGVWFDVDVSFDRLCGRFRRALVWNTLIDLVSASGKRRSLNPMQVVYIEQDAEPLHPAIVLRSPHDEMHYLVRRGPRAWFRDSMW